MSGPKGLRTLIIYRLSTANKQCLPQLSLTFSYKKRSVDGRAPISFFFYGALLTVHKDFSFLENVIKRKLINFQSRIPRSRLNAWSVVSELRLSSNKRSVSRSLTYKPTVALPGFPRLELMLTAAAAK